MKDLHSSIKETVAITPVAIGTTGTGKTSKIIDRNTQMGFGGVEFIIAVGSITATNAVVAATVFEGDVTGTMTSAADADLIGTEAAAGVAAAATRTSGTSKNCVRKIGYKGNKRYCSIKVASTVTAAPIVSVVALLHNPGMAPTA